MNSDKLAIEVVRVHLKEYAFKDPQNPAAEKREPVYLGIQKGNEVIEVDQRRTCGYSYSGVWF
jgi:hypothetical protein